MAEEKLDINNQPIEKKPDTVTDPPKVDVSKTADSAQKLFDKEFEVLKRPEDVIKKATELELTPGNLGEFIHSQQDALTPAISVPTTNPNIDLKKATNLIGDFNLSDEGLGRNYINALEKSAYDSALQRHEDQGRIGQAFGFLAQSIVGEIALGTLEGIGYVLDVDQWANISGESQDEVGNWFSDLMVEGKEQVREFAPIHMDPYKQGEFDPMSSSWWFSNGVSVASTVSILIPVAGWARGVGLAGKGLSTLGKMGKATRVGGKISKGAAKGFNWVDEIGKAAGVEGTAIKNIVQKGGDGINKAVISRHIESMMEASGVYREKVEELMNKGLSEEEARRISAEGAKDVYGANWVMLLQDIPQYLALGKAPKLFKAARDPKILQAQAKALGHEMNPSFWNRAAHTAGFYGKQAASEGFEEMYQYIVGEEGKHSIDVMAGLKKDNALSERLGEYSRSGEMWTSSFFGALGGAAFQAAGPTINNVVAKAFTGIEGGMTETQARITAIQNRSKIIGDINNRLSKAAELNDDAGVEVAKEQIAFELAMNAATVGNIQLDIDALDQMADMDAEQAQKAGMSPEFKEDIAFYKKKMLRAAELWQSNSLQFSPNSVAPITYRQYMMESLAERIPVAEQAIRDAVESIGVIDQMSDAGRSMFNAELQMEGKQNFVDALNHRLKNDKNMSKDQRSQLMNAIKFAETTISQEKAVLDEMKFAEGAVELTDVDKMILGGPHVKNVAKKQANLSFIDNEMRVLSQELGTLMSTEGQKASAEKMEADIKAAQNKKRDEVAKKKQEEIARGGKESTGLSGEEISAGIDSGDINERDLSQTEKDRLAKHKADLADSTPVNDETQTQKEEQPEVSQEGVARKIATGEELSEPEGQFYEANKEKIEGDVEVLDQNNTPVAPDKEIPAGEGKEVAATTEAIVHAITETPKNEDKAVDNDFTGNRAVIAETEQVHAMVQKLAWKSTNNSRTTRDHKEDPEKQALTDFLEGNHSTEGIYFVMEVDTEYQPWVMGSGVWGRRKEMFNSGKVPMSDIGKMPIKATMYRDGAPVIHNGYQLKLYVHDTEFPRTNAEIQEAHDSEVMKLKEMVVRAQLDGKRIRVDFDKKTHGNLKTTRVDNNSFSKNKLDATFNNPVSSDWVYGHDLQFLTRDGGEAFPYFPLAQYTSARSGAIYMVTDTANGSSFPVRLHVDNINTGEAAMIYEIMKVLVSENAYASPISQKFRDRMATSEDPRVRGIYDYMKMEDGREITYGDMLNHLVFSGREATMGKKDSQLWISQATPTTPAELVIGETGRYSAATINTPEAKAAIIAHLVNNRRRQIDVRMLGNKAYKQYLMENSIVTTNAAETPNKRPFVQPSVTYKNPQEVGVPVETKAGEVDAKKADIERRRQEKLELPTNGKLASKHIPKIKAASKTGDNVSNRDNKVIGVVKGLEELEGTQVKLTKEETRALQEIDNDLEFGDIDRTEAIKRRKEVYKKVFTRALESSEIGSVTSLTIEQINAKYDAELAALESQSTQQTGEVELTKAEKDKAKASSGIQAMETARQKEIDGIISVDVAGTIYYRPMTPVGPDTIYADKADVIAEINRKYDTRIDQIKDALKAKEPKVDYAVKAEIIASPQTQIEMEFDTETTATSPKAAEDAEGTVQKPLRSSSSKVSNEDWDAFVDNSEVPLHVREQIVEDLIAGNTLDERQISVYQEVGGAIEQMLRDRVIGSQPTQQTSDADPLAEKLAAAKAKRKGKNRFGGPAAYKKVKGNTPKNQLFSDKEAEHIRTLLPEDIAVQLQDDYVRILQGGWRAVGVFQNGVIEIMRGAERGTGYHEAFHAVYRTMISAQERAKILQDAIKTFPLPMESELAELEEQHPDLNESQILELYYEEQMADEFGSWMYGAGQYTQNKKFPKGIKGFFARLWSWMKNVFSNRRTVEGMFQNIQMGKYRNMPVNTVRGFATKAHKHYTPANVREITQNLAHFAMVDVQAIEDIDKLDTDNIEVELLATIADAEEAGQVESALRLRQLYNEMYVEQDSFFFDEVNKYLISLGLKPKQVDEHTARDLTEDGDTDPVDEDGVLLIPKSYERSGKDTASPNIKLLIALTDEVITDPETGDRSLNYSGYLGLPKKVNFSEVWNKLETNLSDIVGFHDGTTGEWTDAYDIMINKLRAMSQYHEELAEIADKLENSDELIQTQFHRVFSRMKGNYMDHILSGTPGGRPVSKISSAATFTKEEQIHEKWSEQFNQNFRIAQGKEYGFNPAATKELRDQIVAYQKAGGRYVAAVNSTSGFAQEKADVFAEQSKLLNVLGISIKPRAIDKMISTFQDGGANGEQAQANQIVGFARKFVNSLTNIKKAEGSMAPGESMLMNEPFIRLMATFEAEFVPVLGENMKIIGGGNKAWTYQANNSITKRIQTIKQGDLTFLTSLQNTPFGANSVWAGQLMDTPEIRERFETALYGNYKEEAVNDKGDKASNLKKPDQLNDAINKYLSGFTQHKDGKGIFVGLAEADKGQQQYITGPNVIKSYVVGDVKGENLLLDNNSQTVQIFVGYLADELNRWAAAWEHVNSEDPNIAIPEDKQLLYYHYNLKDGKRTRGNAMGSYLFPNLKLESLKDAEGNQLVVEVDKDGNPTTPLITSKEELMKVPEVVDYIKQAILSRVREDIGVAHKYGIIEKTGDGTIRNRTINTEVLENQNVIQGQKEGNRVVNALANYTVNSMIANVEMTKLFTGDPALYKKKGDGFEDFRKRIPAATASGTDARVFKNPDGSWAVRPTYGSATVANIDDMPSTWLSKDTDGKPSDNHKLVAEATGMKANQVADLFDAYNHVNRTDAQAWITFPAYKERMRAFGKWTPAHEEAFQRVIDGKLLPADVKLFAMPLKTVHAELQLMPGGIYSMQYNKQSEAVLIPGIHDQTPLKALMDAMAKNKVDHVITLDGKKAGSVGTTDIADADFTPLEDISLNRVELNHTGLFLQQDLSTKGVKDTLVGVQTVKNVMATVKPDRIYADDMTGEQLLEDYNNVISKLSDIGLREYYKEIGWNEENQTLDQAKLRQAIIKEFEGDVSDNVIDAIQAGIPLDAVQIRRAVQYKTNAMINKKAVKLKQSGGAFVQMSDFGIMGMEVDLNKAVKDNIVWLKDPREELQPMRLEKRKDGSIKTKAAQILIPHKVLKSINQLLSQQGSDKTYKDLSAQEIKDMIDPNVLKGLIYRIPNQGPSSNDAIEIAGFLPPEMGDTIIAYSEITTKTGSDFDIDKAFAILPNYYVDYDSGKVRAVSIKKDNKGGLQNRRLWLMRKMLMHPEAYAQVMAPLDNPWLENSAKELFPGSTQAKDLQFYTGTHQLSTKSLFDNAKALVGVIANHMTHHAITVNETQLTYNVNLGIGQTNKDGLSYVSAAKDVDGKPVEETLGAFMNAIVDAAKDPYISRANINQFTANVAFMLARVGASRNFIVPFMGQPILKRLVDLNDIHEGRISETIRNEEGKRMGALDILLEEYGFSGDAKKFKTLLDTREYDLPSPGALKENIEKPQDTRDFKEKQLDILTQFLKWQEQGKNLNDLIKVSRSDVTGATKNLTSAGILNRLMSEVVKSGNFKGLDKFLGFRETTLYDLMVEQDPENQPEGLWEGDHEPITVWDQGKMLGTYYKNSVLAIRNVMRDVFFSERPAMEQSMLSIARKQGLKISATQRGEALADSLMDNLFTAINDFESSPFHVEQSELIRMIAGKAQEPGQPRPENLPISQRILNAQSDPALESNTFIQSLAISSGNIKLPWLSPKNLDKFSKDDLYLDWMALKEYAADPQLYQDMIHISFYTSGFQRGFGVFNEHIPTSFMTDNNYTGFMNQVSSSMQNPKALAHVENKVIRHLWRQNDIVPSISAKEVMQVKHKDKTFATAQVFMMSPNKSPWQVVGRNAQGLAEYKRFVKRKFTDPNSTVDTWNLYELVGYKGEGKGRLPVYAVTSKMGRSEKGIKLYEYFKEDGTTMIPSNRVSLPDMINDYISGLGNLSPIVSEEIELSDYVMTTDHLSEEQKEESNNRAAFCKKQ